MVHINFIIISFCSFTIKSVCQSFHYDHYKFVEDCIIIEPCKLCEDQFSRFGTTLDCEIFHEISRFVLKTSIFFYCFVVYNNAGNLLVIAARLGDGFSTSIHGDQPSSVL